MNIVISKRSVKGFCYEDPSLIENYDKAIADTSQVWHCHHRVETIMRCGRRELISKGCYYNRPAHELIFLTKAEHSRIHSKCIPKSDEHRRKISMAAYKRWESKEARHAQSQKLKSTFTKHRRDVIRNSKLGKHFYTNGKVCVLRSECPPGFWEGRIMNGRVTTN